MRALQASAKAPGQERIYVAGEKEFENKDGVKEKKKQARLQLEFSKRQYTWDVGVGLTKSSVYGQLMLVGKNKGKLLGEMSFNVNKFLIL